MNPGNGNAGRGGQSRATQYEQCQSRAGQCMVRIIRSGLARAGRAGATQSWEWRRNATLDMEKLCRAKSAKAE